MGSPPRRRCCFQGTSLPLNGSVCTGWEPVSTTWGTPASSTPQCSVSPTPHHLPTTYSQRSTAVPVSTWIELLNAARLVEFTLSFTYIYPNTTRTHIVSSYGSDCSPVSYCYLVCKHMWLNVSVECKPKQLRKKNKGNCLCRPVFFRL